MSISKSEIHFPLFSVWYNFNDTHTWINTNIEQQQQNTYKKHEALTIAEDKKLN